jgi:hypothetical protein
VGRAIGRFRLDRDLDLRIEMGEIGLLAVRAMPVLGGGRAGEREDGGKKYNFFLCFECHRPILTC